MYFDMPCEPVQYAVSGRGQGTNSKYNKEIHSIMSQTWWCVAIVSVNGRLKQKDQSNIKASLGYRVRRA